MPDSNSLLEHLHHLTDSLRRLKERVREAVAGELSRLVAQTVQEVIHALLQRPVRSVERDDPWEDDSDYSSTTDTSAQKLQAPRRWYGWLFAVTQVIVSYVARPRHPWWPAVILAGTGLAAVSQRPLLLTALEAVQTTTELLTR